MMIITAVPDMTVYENYYLTTITDTTREWRLEVEQRRFGHAQCDAGRLPELAAAYTKSPFRVSG